MASGSDIMNQLPRGVMSANFNCQIVSTEQSEAVITGEDAVTTILEQLESAGIRGITMPFWLLRCMSTQEKSGEVKYDNDPLAYVGGMKFCLAVVDLVASGTVYLILILIQSE